MREEVEELSATRTVPLDLSAVTRQRKLTFALGDSVVFTRGDLKGLKGVVESVEGETVHVRSKELPEPVSSNRKDLSKTFSAGDSVKVASGRHAGQSGVVVDVKGEILVIFNDVTKEELKVRLRKLCPSNRLTSS